MSAANRALRADLRSRLLGLSIEHIHYITTRLLDDFPDDEDLRSRLTQEAKPPPEPPVELPQSLEEPDLWPLILAKQAQNALSNDPKVALGAATFFARVYRKIGDTTPKSKEKDAAPQKTQRELLEEAAALAAESLGHEPGEATTVDSGVKVR